MTVEETIRQTVAEVARVSPSTIQPDTDLIHDLSLSSLELLQVLASVEDRYDVSIPNDELVELSTLRRISTKVEQLLKVETPIAAAG